MQCSAVQYNCRPPYYNNKPKREGKDPANMSNYETNPVGALQVRNTEQWTVNVSFYVSISLETEIIAGHYDLKWCFEKESVFISKTHSKIIAPQYHLYF